MRNLLRLILLIILVGGCVLVAASLWALERLPRQAAEIYGPPGRSLSLSQRVMYSTQVLAAENVLLTPLDQQGAPRVFTVSLGESVNSITTRLEAEGFIANADALRIYLIYAGLDTNVQAGKYQISPAMTAVQIGRMLQDAVPEEVEFHILPGWRAEEIAASLPTSGLMVLPQEFLSIVRNPPDDISPTGRSESASLEGFLMPGQYSIKRGISAHDLVALFVARFDTSVTPEMRSAYTAHGLSLEQAVILASMVQREAVVTDEQPLIASVFYNRLSQNMRLESDPTVQYAWGYIADQKTWWKNPLTADDLQIDSGYNTYRVVGFPAGPIASPGRDALQAVANPAQTGYFYFRAKCDGSGRHAFAVTYEEHIQNSCP